MATISFKVSPEEARAIRKRARQEEMTVSAFLRRQAILPPPPAPAVELKTCPKTGATIFDSLVHSPALDVEKTREILADFP
jgi:hypothetical protein